MSGYLRISGISTGDLHVTVKKDQGIWPEWTDKNSAVDIQNIRYTFVEEENQWYAERPTELEVSSAANAA